MGGKNNTELCLSQIFRLDYLTKNPSIEDAGGVQNRLCTMRKC